MSFDHAQKKFLALPAQIIEVANGVILKRGCAEVKIHGESAAKVIRAVMAAASGEGATHEEICERFAMPDRPTVGYLIDQLIDRRLLVARDDAHHVPDGHESNRDIFYWHFDQSPSEALERLNSQTFMILGVNSISGQLVWSLLASGIKTIRVIDHPFLRNLRFFDSSAELKPQVWSQSSIVPEKWNGQLPSDLHGCVVATSDFVARRTFRELNKIALAEKLTFLPVFLHNLVGYVGPFVIPGETACFECLLSRKDSNLEDREDYQNIEAAGFDGQQIVAFHPAMGAILGEIAAFELIKFYGELIPCRKVGTLIEINLLAMRLTARKVLKIPRCSACSPLLTRPSTTPKMTVFSPLKRAPQ